MKESIRKQTIVLTGLNGMIRAMGFLLRVLLSRQLGAEAMGVVELASGVHMLAITPLTSGLPMAVSRLTAKEKEQKKTMPLYAGLRLIRMVSLFLIPVFILVSPIAARLTGDIRVLPSLFFTAPCILILGFSGVYNGYCYGIGRSYLPAVSELTEQGLRLFFTLCLLPLLARLTTPWLAAVPVASTMFAEIAGLVLVIISVRIPALQEDPKPWTKPLLHLAVPSTITRLIHTLIRSVTSIIIPLRLYASGLGRSEATARLGMLNGMVLPVMMLPCIFTGALSMVMMPRLAKTDGDIRHCRKLLWNLLCAGIPVSLACSAGLWSAAPIFAQWIYRLPELTELFRAATPLCLLCATENLTGGAIAALGLQKSSMYGAFPSTILSLILTWILTAIPTFRLYGVIAGLAAGHVFAILWNAGVLVCRLKRQSGIER